jgi:hypothetical protein
MIRFASLVYTRTGHHSHKWYNKESKWTALSNGTRDAARVPLPTAARLDGHPEPVATCGARRASRTADVEPLDVLSC